MYASIIKNGNNNINGNNNDSDKSGKNVTDKLQQVLGCNGADFTKGVKKLTTYSCVTFQYWKNLWLVTG